MIDVFPAEQQAQIRIQLASALQLASSISGWCPGSAEAWSRRTKCWSRHSAVRNLIKEGKTNQLRNSLVTGSRDGMETLEQSLSGLLQDGTVTEEDALARSLYP